MSSVDHVPEKLRPAIEHLQDTFDTSDFKLSWITDHLCFADLHPSSPHRYPGLEDDLPSLRLSFEHLKRILGTQTAQHFDLTIQPRTESAIFHAYAEIYQSGLKNSVRQMFVDVFQIAIANADLVGSNPIGWAADQVKNRIDNGHHRFNSWIKRVCDLDPMDEDVEELVWRRKWRAPQFIIMRPSGNTPYNATTAWNREDEQRTKQLLTSLSTRSMEGLEFELDRVVGQAHVLHAKQRRPQAESRVSEVSGPDELEDYKFAKMAIEQARKSVAEPGDKPRPMVGAVVVKNGSVLSTGFRGEYAPGNHAEYVAMEVKLKGKSLEGATVYTTLEPCTTRNDPKIPCAKRLIERNVKRVVIAMLDPDKRIRGLGQIALRKAKIIIGVFPSDLTDEAEELNQEFTRFCEEQYEKNSPITRSKDQLESLKGQRVRLRPVAKRRNENGFLPDADDDWIVLNVEDDALQLRNERTAHKPKVSYDQIQRYLSDPNRDRDGIIHGFLQLKVQFTLTGNDVLVEPLA